MIAKVLVKQKTSKNEVFDYFVGPEINVTPFSIVEVPFRNKKMLGIVLSVDERSEKAKKSILRTLTTGPALTAEQYKIAQKIADEFISSPSKALFSFLPNLNIKDLKKITPPIASVKRVKFKKCFVRGSFWERVNYYIGSDNRDSQSIIIIPEISTINEAARMYKKISDKKVYTWHSRLSSSSKTQIMNELMSGRGITIISTRHGIFLPFTNLENIFLEQPTNFAHFEDQEPYYNTYKTARLISQIYRANLVVGDSLPDLVSFAAIKSKKLELIDLTGKLSISISNSFTKLTGDIALLNDLDQNNDILITGFFKDFYGLICLECKSSVKCSRCNLTHFSLDKNTCISCRSNAPLICPNCHSARIVKTGATVLKVQEILNKSELSNKFEVRDAQELIDLKPKFNLALIPYFDFYSNFPFISFREKIFRTILGLVNLGVKKVWLFGEDLQNQDFANQIKQNGWKKFLEEELKNRKISDMPPFKTAIKIEIKNLNKIQTISTALSMHSQVINDGNTLFIFVDNNKVKQIARAIKDKLGQDAKVRIDPVEFA